MMALNLELPRLGLGCAALANFAYKSDVTKDEAIALIKYCLQSGVTHFDTAIMYGPHISERIVGEALKDTPRSEVFVATKTGFVIENGEILGVSGKPDFIRRTCLESLQRLQMDYIDLLYLHRIDTNTPIEETMRELKTLVAEGFWVVDRDASSTLEVSTDVKTYNGWIKDATGTQPADIKETEGKIRHIGLSEASAKTIEAAHKIHPISAVQVEWSLWTRDGEEAVIPKCRELGIKIVAFSPMGQGMFTGAVKSCDQFQDGDVRQTLPRFSRQNFEKNKVFYDRVEKFAERRGCTPAQLAIAWVLAQGDDVCTIPGACRIKEFEEDWKAKDIVLSKDELDKLSNLVPPEEVVGDRCSDEHPTFKDN